MAASFDFSRLRYTTRGLLEISRESPSSLHKSFVFYTSFLHSNMFVIPTGDGKYRPSLSQIHDTY